MKRLFIIMFMAMFAVSLFASAKIKFEATELDFGEIDAGKVVDLEFKFENVGDELLIIKNVSASCGCTTAKLEKKEYKPGEKGVVPVQFYSRGYNGKVVKTVTISTNDKDQVYTRLKISGNVNLKDFAAIEMPEDKVEFGDVTIGERKTAKVKLKNSGSINLRIIDVTHSPDVYPVFPKIEIKPNEEMEIEIIYTPMESGRYASFIKVRSNAHRQRMVIIKVNAQVK